MIKSGIAAMIALCGAAYGTGEVFLGISVSDTGNGDGIIEPGESALLTVSALMVDLPGGGTLYGYGGSVLDLPGGDGTGDVSAWTIHNNLADIVGDTTIDNGEFLSNVSTLQLDFTGVVTDNPIALITFRWDTTDYSARVVGYRTDLTPSGGVVGVLVKNDKGKVVSENWPGFEGEGLFLVVPTPASMAILGLGGLAATRRRR